MPDILKKFGKYFLLDLIAQGGMAEIYRARMASLDAGSRLLVIKRIQAGFGQNSEFVRMFRSEINVTMGFNHPNIVQLYDFGEELKQPFIAMELVEGRNLRQLSMRFVEINQSLPVELATYIGEQAAAGLQYAHSFKDKISGEPLSIVHRDISPQNILISYEGNVKVIDFGIAKATNSDSTRAGVIKGKPSYLSPEQISGSPLDGRSDIFALGAVIWEMLTNRKLFAGENDLAVLKLIENCQRHVKAPSSLNSKVPPELDQIVLKCLTKSPENRFQTAEELQRALHKLLYSFQPNFNPADLAHDAKELFKGEIIEDRKKIQKLNERAEALIRASLSSVPPPSSDPDPPLKTPALHRPAEDDAESDGDALEPGDPETPVAAAHSRSKKLKKEAAGARAAAASSPGKASTASREAVFQVQQSPGRIELESTQFAIPHKANPLGPPVLASVGTSRPLLHPTQVKTRYLAKPAASHTSWLQLLALAIPAMLLLAFFGPDFGVSVPVLSPWLNGSSSSSPAASASLSLTGNYEGVEIRFNGQLLPDTTRLPTAVKGLSIGVPLQLTVVSREGSFSQVVSLKAGEQKTLPVTLSQAAAVPALVTPPLVQKSIVMALNIVPASAQQTITLNGTPVNPQKPSLEVPLDAPLDLSIQQPGYRAFRKEFVLESKNVKNQKAWLMEIQLEPTEFGLLNLKTTPSAEATIMIHHTPHKLKTPIENEKLPVGSYDIVLRNELLGMGKSLHVTISNGQVITLDERLEIKN